MGPIFFECYWTILDFVDFDIFDGVRPLLRSFDCEMWCISWGDGIHQIEGGYKAMSCIVQTPSVDVFNRLSKEIEKHLPLRECHPIPAPHWHDDDGLNAIPNTASVDLIQNLNQLAEYNQAVLHKTTLWVSGIWTVKPVNTDDVDYLLQILAEKNCSLFYKPPFRPYDGSPIWMVVFFLKVNEVHLFDDFSKQLGQVFSVQGWSWIYKNSSIELNLEKLLPLTHETMNEFIQLIQRTSN